jgi:hypothetical protein
MVWLQSLTPEQQVAVAALVAAWLTQAVKWALAKGGHPLGESTGAKLQKLAVVAVSAALTAFVLTGPTAAFWGKWAAAVCGAIASHEVFWKLINNGLESVPDKEDEG